MFSLLIAVILVLVPLSEQEARFDNYKVYRIIPETEEQIEVLAQLENSENYNFWSFGRNGRPVDIMVPPHLSDEFVDLVKSQGMEPTVFIDDVQERINNENPANPVATPLNSNSLGWTSYHRLDHIYAWLRSLALQYPNTVRLVTGGQSSQGRQILGVHVSFSRNNINRGVFLEGGIHAREWISPATVTYILNELLTSTDTNVRRIAHSHDWYVFPITNPDGYEFTHTNNRMWRKTRRQFSIFCFGADPNRNFGFRWNTGGVSNQPCADTYAGPSAFSEIETRTLSEYINTIASRLKAYLSIHSFTQLLLLPYGTRGVGRPSNYDELLTRGQASARALSRRYGTQYTVGNIVDVLYVASGSSLDWVKGVHNVNLTYVFELRDLGHFGFILPANQIIPTGEETLDAIVELLKD